MPAIPNLDIEAASRWVIDRLPDFDPFKDGRSWRIEHGQRLGELATAVYCWAEMGDSAVPDAVAAMADLLEKVQGRPDFRDRPFRSPAEFILMSDVYAGLRRVGRDDPSVRAQLQAFVDSGRLEASERLPHRLMDVRLGLEWAGLRHDWPSLEDLSKRTLLARNPSAFDLDEAAAYALTHVIMFLYGFGTRPADISRLIDPDDLGVTLSSLIAVSAGEGQWDLLAELLLCWDCAGLAATNLYLEAWDCLRSLQREDGSLPGPTRALRNWGVGDIETLAIDDGARRELEMTYRYHTTLVAIMAGLVHRRAGSRAQGTAPADPAPLENGPEQPRVAHDSRWRPGTPTAIVDVAERSGDWARQVAMAAASVDEPSHMTLLAALVAGWLADEIAARDLGYQAEIAELAFEALLRADWDTDSAEALPGTSWLKISAAALLLSRGRVVPRLHAWLVALAAALEHRDPPDDSATIGEARLLLQDLGILAASIDGPSSEDPPLPVPSLTDRPAIEGLVAEINLRTRFGTVQLAAYDSLRPATADLVAAGVAQALVRNDLQNGSRAMRALGYLAPDRIDAIAHRRQLFRQERIGGGFGFFGLEAAELSRAGGLSLDAVAMDLSARATVETLWTLAESSPAWRYLSALPTVGPMVVSQMMV